MIKQTRYKFTTKEESENLSFISFFSIFLKDIHYFGINVLSKATLPPQTLFNALVYYHY